MDCAGLVIQTAVLWLAFYSIVAFDSHFFFDIMRNAYEWCIRLSASLL
jgi:hypothetical protein